MSTPPTLQLEYGHFTEHYTLLKYTRTSDVRDRRQTDRRQMSDVVVDVLQLLRVVRTINNAL